MAAKKGKSLDGRGRREVKVPRAPKGDSFALPVDVVRRLVSQIVARGGVEPFVGRLLPLIDGLRAGRTGEATRAARRSKDRHFRRLASALGRAAARGQFVVAHNTALLAASYAYRDSLDYVCKLFDYLDAVRAKNRAGRV